MQHQPIPSQLRAARAFDGIACGLFATVVMISHPRLGYTLLGDVSNACLIPFCGVVLATLSLPGTASADAKLAGMVFRTKVAGVTVLALAPFISWWLRARDVPYFLVMASSAFAAGIWYLLELTGLVGELVRRCSAMGLVLEAKIARGAIVYLNLVLVLAVHVSFVVAIFLFPGTVLSDLQRTWATVPLMLRIDRRVFVVAMLLPVLLTIRLLFRSHAALVGSPHDLLGAVERPPDREGAENDGSIGGTGIGDAGQDDIGLKDVPMQEKL